MISALVLLAVIYGGYRVYAATTGDISVGDNVTVAGTASSDGSLTAQMIDVRGNQPAGSPSQTPMIPAGQ